MSDSSFGEMVAQAPRFVEFRVNFWQLLTAVVAVMGGLFTLGSQVATATSKIDQVVRQNAELVAEFREHSRTEARRIDGLQTQLLRTEAVDSAQTARITNVEDQLRQERRARNGGH